MKRISIVLSLALAALLCLDSLSAYAVTEFSDGIYTFTKTETGGAIVTDCNLTQENIEVPDFVLGYPVAGIGDYAFFSNNYAKNVELPLACSSIGEFAFADSESLQSVSISRWCTSISDNAFWNSPNVTVYCRSDSFARTYSEENGIRYMMTDLFMYGDSNLDAEIDITDATEVQKCAAELIVLSPTAERNSDANHDGNIDINDVTTIQRFVAELLETLEL